ncbi:Hypothetical protein P9515_12971 [Prochlorococcus marinus str. MIT 9515]|uniref:Uncharacterized protein n=1 Tax=Prochlorococcus marinus (strain MIT 9515) TaxID=167542 RepID=A2BXJ3_PROM5|nr:hypothetical protein [Prochlorococcus marinus]ABM72504.1 Hypothetical protein P9515_12971 [Prochlorococcus marinus str. MIT 9515]
MLLTHYWGTEVSIRTIGLANVILKNIGYSILGEDLCLKVKSYKLGEELDPFGMELWKDGREFEVNSKIRKYDDCDLSTLLSKGKKQNESLIYEGLFQEGWFLKENEERIRNMFNLPNVSIRDPNDMIVFVRLGDVAHIAPPYSYYQDAIETIQRDLSPKSKSYSNVSSMNNSYIATDSPNHPIVKRLIKKYCLKLVKYNDVDTILFAREFDNIILTAGTYNWLAAFLSKAKNIIYPEHAHFWHGDIYGIFNWTKIKWRSKAPLRYLIINRYFQQYDDFIHFYRYLKRIIRGVIISPAIKIKGFLRKIGNFKF